MNGSLIALLHQNCDKIWLVLSAFTFMNSGPVWPSQVICAAFCCEAQMQFEVHPSFGCDQFFHIERCCAGCQDCFCFSLWLRANFILLIRMCLPFELDHIYLRASIVLPLTFGNSILVQARGIFHLPMAIFCHNRMLCLTLDQWLFCWLLSMCTLPSAIVSACTTAHGGACNSIAHFLSSSMHLLVLSHLSHSLLGSAFIFHVQ